MNIPSVLWLVLIVAAVAAVVLALALIAGRRRREANRHRAADLRAEAASSVSDLPHGQTRLQQAEQRAERARSELRQAEAEVERARREVTMQRAQHEDRVRAADHVDPDVDQRSDDYRPDTTAADSAPPPARPAPRPHGPGED